MFCGRSEAPSKKKDFSFAWVAGQTAAILIITYPACLSPTINNKSETLQVVDGGPIHTIMSIFYYFSRQIPVLSE